MAQATNIVQPDNKEIVQKTKTTSVRQYRVETATNVINARLVIKGTTDGDIVVAGDEATSALGWVVRDETISGNKENDRTTAYTAGEIIAVCRGPGTQLIASLSEACAIGARLVPAASGQLKVFNSDAADIIVAIAEQTLTQAGFCVVTSQI